METTNRADALLDAIGDKYGIGPDANREAIEKELAAEETAYKGLGIRILSIAGGLLATGFFLGFVAVTLLDVPMATIIFGLLVIGGAVVLTKSSTSTILDTLLISSYLAGFAMIGFGLGKLEVDSNTVAATLLLLAVITVAVTSGYMLNFFSVLIASGCLFSFIFINDAYKLIHVYVPLFAAGYVWLCLWEPKLIARNAPFNKRYMALRNGVLFSFIGFLLYVGSGYLHYKEFGNGYFSGAGIILVTAFVLHRIVGALSITASSAKLLIYVLAGLLLLSTLFAPAICGALLIIFLSYYTGHRTGLNVGVICLIYFTGQYYYDLDYTLLQKSLSMMATGVLFLAGWFILKKQLKRNEQN